MFDASPIPTESAIRGTIYVVDADEAIHTLTQEAARRLGYACETFTEAGSFLNADKSDDAQCVFANLGLPSADLHAILRLAKASNGHLDVVCLAGEGSISDVVGAINAGASTVVQKPATSEQLEEVAREAVQRSKRSESLSRRYRELAEHVAQLSDREHRVVQQISSGALNKVIAGNLEVSVRTVESDRARVVEKLGAQTTGEAVAKYAQFQVLSDLGFRLEAEESTPA